MSTITEAPALAQFKKVGMPTIKDENWKSTDLSALANETFSAPHAITSSAFAEKVLRKLAPTKNRLVFINGFFSKKYSRIGLSRAAVTISSSTNPGVSASAHPTKKSTPFRSLNAALSTDGALITVKKSDKAPLIEIIFIADTSIPQTQAVRNTIALESGAQATLIERFHGQGKFLSNSVTEVKLAKKAQLSHYVFQEQPQSAFHFGHMDAELAADSQLESFVLSSGGKLARNEASVIFKGKGAQVNLSGLYLARHTQHVDCHLDIQHPVADCKSRQQYRGILQDQAHGVFNGKVYVHPKAEKSVAQQINKTILTSPEAQINTKPQLEIFAEDVQCTHGAAVGQLDEAALFYARARGLEENEARQVVLQGFINETLLEVSDEIVRQEMSTHIQEWLSQKQT
jgi:Fe-S cluster assembly protein SufD